MCRVNVASVKLHGPIPWEASAECCLAFSAAQKGRPWAGAARGPHPRHGRPAHPEPHAQESPKGPPVDPPSPDEAPRGRRAPLPQGRARDLLRDAGPAAEIGWTKRHSLHDPLSEPSSRRCACEAPAPLGLLGPRGLVPGGPPGRLGRDHRRRLPAVKAPPRPRRRRGGPDERARLGAVRRELPHAGADGVAVSTGDEGSRVLLGEEGIWETPGRAGGLSSLAPDRRRPAEAMRRVTAVRGEGSSGRGTSAAAGLRAGRAGHSPRPAQSSRPCTRSRACCRRCRRRAPPPQPPGVKGALDVGRRWREAK